MFNYIFSYILPVLAVMAVLLIIAKKVKGGAKFKMALLICIGFLIGWASAFISIYIYFFRG